MGRKGKTSQASVFQRKASSAAGPPGSQAKGSTVNLDDANSGSDATGLFLIQKVALVQQSDIFFYSPRPPTNTQHDKNQPFHLPSHQFARLHFL